MSPGACTNIGIQRQISASSPTCVKPGTWSSDIGSRRTWVPSSVTGSTQTRPVTTSPPQSARRPLLRVPHEPPRGGCSWRPCGSRLFGECPHLDYAVEVVGCLGQLARERGQRAIEL